jgi:hypothetical protein
VLNDFGLAVRPSFGPSGSPINTPEDSSTVRKFSIDFFCFGDRRYGVATDRKGSGKTKHAVDLLKY